MPLNPYAKPFLPSSCRLKKVAPIVQQQELFKKEQPQDDQQPSTPAQAPLDACFPLAELPSELLAAVAAGLSTPQDLGSLVQVSKRLLAAVKDARISFSLTPAQQNAFNNPRNAKQLDAMVACIAKYYAGATELHLANLPLEVHHVQLLLAALPRLTTLDLSACKKLTPPLISTLAAALQPQKPRANSAASASSDSNTQQCGRASGLMRLNLQRCYQLDAECLPQLLGLFLECLALSHLELRFCPWDSIAAGCAPALRTLALNNCSQLSAAGLLAVARGCCQLEHLFLGGCTFAASAVDTAAQAQAAAPAGGAVVQVMGAGDEQALPPTQQQQRPQSAAAVARHGAAVLGDVLALLPQLKVLEVTFMGVAQLMQGHNTRHNNSCSISSKGGAAVWDLCRPSDVQAALRTRQEAGANSSVAMALRCAVNASGKGRTTPLHVAADSGDAERCAALLALGASPSARDGAGSVPLFLAAEGGHAEAARQLLTSPGADACACNTVGESPLYISALRGHAAVVGVLLEHLSAAGVQWQRASLYGDAWTPLMAAAVADRTDVAGRLLAAAGPSARSLVAAANRYGQTVMHIAARKGSQELLSLLVQHGGADSAWVPDTLGETPVSIARKNRHQHFLRLVVAPAC